MNPALARTLLLVIAAIGLIAGVLFIGASGQTDSHLGIVFLIVGGTAGIVLLGVTANRR